MNDDVPFAVAAVALAARAASPAVREAEPPPEVVRPVQLDAGRRRSDGARPRCSRARCKPRHEADLGFRIGGKIVARRVDVGAHVKKGQVLARLDPRTSRCRREAAEGAGRGGRDRTSISRRRSSSATRTCTGEKFVSDTALDAEAQHARRQPARSSSRRRANLAVSQNQASYATLVANDDGVVTAVNAEPGQVVDGRAAGRAHRARRTSARSRSPCPRTASASSSRRAALVVVLWANPGQAYRGARARDLARRRSRRRARSRCASPIAGRRRRRVQWGMTANVGVHRRGRRAARRCCRSTSIYHARDGKPAVWVYDPATRQGRRSRRVALGPYREDGVGRDVGRCATATGSSRRACTSCVPARSCGRTKRRASRRRRRRPRARTRPTRAASERSMTPQCRRADAALALQPLRVGARRTARSCCTSSSCSR